MEIRMRRLAIRAPEALAEVLSNILKKESEIDRNKEHFWTIGFNTRNVIQYIELVSLGTLNASLAHPRETFRFAVMKGVASIAIAHNHPSGDIEPSDDDIALSRRLKQAGQILGIDVLDHIIIAANKEFTSFKCKGLL